MFTADALGLVKRDDVDVVVEVVGGIEPARTWLLEALRRGKSVVTANKALLAEDGATLHDARPRAAPTCSTRRASPAPSRCCARCASRCTETGSPGSPASSTAPRTSSSARWTRPAPSFAEALEEATALGYAEADPTADVEGFDAAAKAAILASLAFHSRVTAARRLPRGHHRGHRDRRRQRAGRWAA
jgi:homoserine dehydrogenase